MEIQYREHHVPNDQLLELHYLDNDCWCFPAALTDITFHRPAHVIDVVVRDEHKYISGWVTLKAPQSLPHH